MTERRDPTEQLLSRIEPWPSADAPLRAQWGDLADRLGCNPSLRPGWIDVAAASIADPDAELRVFIVRRGDSSLEGFVPFFASNRRMAGVGMRVLQLASNLMSYHAEVLALNDADEVLRAFLAAAPRWDVLHAANIVLGSPTDTAIRAVARGLGGVLQIISGDASPYLPIEGTWEELISRKGKKFRYKLRRRSELLEQHPDTRLRWFSRTDEVDELLDHVLAIEARSWKSKAGIDIASREIEVRYHRLLLQYLAKEEMLHAGVLYLDTVPAAYSLCCHFGAWVGHLKTSFDERFGNLSPGALVIDVSVQKAFSLGATEFDFLGDAGAHKLAWTTLTRSHADFFLFAPRLKPRTIGTFKRLKASLWFRRTGRGLRECDYE